MLSNLGIAEPPPRLEGGDTFEAIAEYIGRASARYFANELASTLEVTALESDPAEFGAQARRYQLRWCTALAREIAKGFGCVSSLQPYSSKATFYGESLAARCAGELYAYTVAEIDRFTPGEYVRRYKRAIYHKEKPEYGWRKHFIQDAIEQIEEQVRGVIKELPPVLLSRVHALRDAADARASAPA